MAIITKHSHPKLTAREITSKNKREVEAARRRAAAKKLPLINCANVVCQLKFRPTKASQRFCISGCRSDQWRRDRDDNKD